MDKQNIKHGFEEYFVHSKFFMTATGTWPLQRKVSRIIFRFIYTFQISTVLIPMIIKLVLNTHDADLLIESVASILYQITLTVKFTNGILKREKMASLLQKIKSDWESLTDESEIKILGEHAGFARSLGFSYICFLNGSMLFYMSLPIKAVILDYFNPLNVSRPREQALLTEFFVDPEDYFYVMLAHSVTTGCLSMMAILANDTFIFNCIHHACGMMTILGCRIQEAFTQKKQITIKNKEIKDNFKEIVKHVVQHQHIIEFCDDLNDVFSTSLFFVVTLCVVLLSMTGMEVVIKLDNDSKDYLRYCLFFSGQVFHLYSCNYAGQRLIDHGEQLNDLICSSRWYTSSEKSKNIFKFIMLRSADNCKLEAHFFLLNLESFTQVMKTSMSYFTVLKQSR